MRNFTRSVNVDRDCGPREVLARTNRRQYVMDDVVLTMPRGEGEAVEIIFFETADYIRYENIDKEFASRSLKPADPYSLAAFNAANPSFGGQHPHSAHWQDADGKRCQITFGLHEGEDAVYVQRGNFEYSRNSLHAGIRIST